MLRFTDGKCCAITRIENILHSEIQRSAHTEPSKGNGVLMVLDGSASGTWVSQPDLSNAVPGGRGGVGAGQCPGAGLHGGSSLLKELACHLSNLENDKFTAAVCNEFISSQARSKCWTLAWGISGES